MDKTQFAMYNCLHWPALLDASSPETALAKFINMGFNSYSFPKLIAAYESYAARVRDGLDRIAASAWGRSHSIGHNGRIITSYTGSTLRMRADGVITLNGIDYIQCVNDPYWPDTLKLKTQDELETCQLEFVGNMLAEVSYTGRDARTYYYDESGKVVRKVCDNGVERYYINTTQYHERFNHEMRMIVFEGATLPITAKIVRDKFAFDHYDGVRDRRLYYKIINNCVVLYKIITRV